MPPERPSYGDQRRRWHPDFVEYMYSIVQHPNYADMPCTTDDEGKIDWIIPSNRKRGSKNWDGNVRRKAWWQEKAQALGIPLRRGWISRTAKALHPTGRKPCQTCGRVMEIAYAYPRRTTIGKLNAQLPVDEQLAWEDLLSVFEVVDHFANVYGKDSFGARLAAVFPGLSADVTAAGAKEHIAEAYVRRESRLCSPGAMSNPPDRLDGFHTYNLCCRQREDTGRATDNLRTYGDDRRAFEQWCEGDWAAANLLMKRTGQGVCAAGLDCLSGMGRVVSLTADHVGPISLGFQHSPDFRPLCGPCNSARNRRMTLADVELLLVREEHGRQVASWQAAFLWDRCKRAVRNDDDALCLSSLMRFSQHHFLLHLHEALEAGVPDVLLQFLNPALAGEKVEFIDLDPVALTYGEIRRTPRSPSYARSKAARMVRIAYDALADYAGKAKRNVQVVAPELVAGPLQRYHEALRYAQGEPSSWRAELIDILRDEDLTPEERATRLSTLFHQGHYLPDHDYRYVGDALAELMAAYADVLARRFANGETVAWDDALEA